MIDAYNRERGLHINRASFFDMHASRQSLHLFLFLFFVVVLYGKYVARFPLLDGVVYLVTTGWSFDIITRRLV